MIFFMWKTKFQIVYLNHYVFEIATKTERSGPEGSRYIQNLMYYSFRLTYNFNLLMSCPNIRNFLLFLGFSNVEIDPNDNF